MTGLFPFLQILLNDWEGNWTNNNNLNSMEGHLVTAVIAFGLQEDVSSRTFQYSYHKILFLHFLVWNVVYNKSRGVFLYFEWNRKFLIPVALKGKH